MVAPPEECLFTAEMRRLIWLLPHWGQASRSAWQGLISSSNSWPQSLQMNSYIIIPGLLQSLSPDRSAWPGGWHRAISRRQGHCHAVFSLYSLSLLAVVKAGPERFHLDFPAAAYIFFSTRRTGCILPARGHALRARPAGQPGARKTSPDEFCSARGREASRRLGLPGRSFGVPSKEK